jgi:type I restriction enzyme R subunit
MQPLDEQKAILKAAHQEIMEYIAFPIHVVKPDKVKDEYKQLVQALGSIDAWYQFKIKAKAFLKAYEALCPDPEILRYTEDMKWIALFLEYGALSFEKKESFTLKDYSAKIRDMLNAQLDVTGIKTLIRLKHITDPDFFEDFKTTGKDEEEIRDTVLRKVSELKKTITERVADNPQEYETFSERILALIRKFESGLVDAADILKQAEDLAKDVVDEDNAHKKTGLTKNAYGIWKILEAFKPKAARAAGQPSEAAEKDEEFTANGLLRLQKIALDIDGIYLSDQTAPIGWHLKEQLRKELRQMVRHIALEAELDWRQVPVEVEKYAMKHYIKIG